MLGSSGIATSLTISDVQTTAVEIAAGSRDMVKNVDMAQSSRLQPAPIAIGLGPRTEVVAADDRAQVQTGISFVCACCLRHASWSGTVHPISFVGKYDSTTPSQ